MSASGPLLFHLGASHHTAPLELREKIALPPEKVAQLRNRLANANAQLSELAVLNTCNRVEFYGIASTPTDIATLEAIFCEIIELPTEAFAAIATRTQGAATLRHLCTVAAGLDSQLLGENEIFGQVKEAYAAATAQGAIGPVLNRAFQKTFQIAKHVRTHTGITEGQVSAANIAVEIAIGIFGDLSSTRVLLLGAGEIGEKTAKAFQSRGAVSLTVSSRTAERALTLARTLDATALPFEHFTRHLGNYDVVVSATAAPGSIITQEDVVAAVSKRKGAPLLLLDLALPRDIEPTAAAIDGVYLYNLDDLARIAEKNRATREAEATRAKALIHEKADALWNQICNRYPS